MFKILVECYNVAIIAKIILKLRILSSTFTGQITGSCTNGNVKLWRPNNIGPEYYGLALYCKNNAWTGVCDDSWTCHTARLICQQLGYVGAICMF